MLEAEWVVRRRWFGKVKRDVQAAGRTKEGQVSWLYEVDVAKDDCRKANIELEGKGICRGGLDDFGRQIRKSDPVDVFGGLFRAVLDGLMPTVFD